MNTDYWLKELGYNTQTIVEGGSGDKPYSVLINVYLKDVALKVASVKMRVYKVEEHENYKELAAWMSRVSLDDGLIGKAMSIVMSEYEMENGDKLSFCADVLLKSKERKNAQGCIVYIDTLWVRASFRRRGICKALIHDIESILYNSGMSVYMMGTIAVPYLVRDGKRLGPSSDEKMLEIMRQTGIKNGFFECKALNDYSSVFMLRPGSFFDLEKEEERLKTFVGRITKMHVNYDY